MFDQFYCRYLAGQYDNVRECSSTVFLLFLGNSTFCQIRLVQIQLLTSESSEISGNLGLQGKDPDIADYFRSKVIIDKRSLGRPAGQLPPEKF